MLSSLFSLIFFLEAQCPLYEAFMSIKDSEEDTETKSVNVQGSWFGGAGRGGGGGESGGDTNCKEQNNQIQRDFDLLET